MPVQTTNISTEEFSGHKGVFAQDAGCEGRGVLNEGDLITVGKTQIPWNDDRTVKARQDFSERKVVYGEVDATHKRLLQAFQRDPNNKPNDKEIDALVKRIDDKVLASGTPEEQQLSPVLRAR